MNRKFNFTKEQLHQLYIIEGKSAKKIAKELNANFSTVLDWLKRLNIPVRSQKKYDLTNKKIGRWTVISKVANDNIRTLGCRARWVCKCDCGNIREVMQQSLIGGHSESCGCLARETQWKGMGELSSYYFNMVKRRAANSKMEFNISLEYVWELFLKQDSKCAISGESLVFWDRWTNHTQQTASLDRIDSSKGYIEGNVQWVHKDINYMKTDLSMEELLNWIKKIYEFNEL